MRTLKVAWWDKVPNFGDILTPIILERLAQIKAEHVEPKDAELIGIGSYLEIIPKNYKGIIWGTGKMFGETKINLSKMNILALRGYLTFKGSKAHCNTFGDPGLLVRYIAPHSKHKKYPIGIISHWNDKSLNDLEGHHIKITDNVDDIIYQTSECEKIISSSLHGLILADSLGIPRMWKKVDSNPGDGFKFRDYQSAYGDKIIPDKWYKVDSNKVEEKCNFLLEKLKKI